MSLSRMLCASRLFIGSLTTGLVPAAMVLAAGCAASADDADGQGQVELRVEAPADVTRVTLAADGGAATELVRDANGAFSGSLVLAVGAHELVARAYADTELVGQSNPASVQVQLGTVTRATLHVLDAGAEPVATFGPLFDSLSYPTSVTAGAAASFAMSALSPVGAAVSYAWTSSCADAAFSSQAATTTWTKPTPGGCTVEVTATSSGISLSRSFAIVVFPTNSDSGAVTADIDFVYRPQAGLQLYNGCSAFPGLRDYSCQNAAAAPVGVGFTYATISWGGSAAGDLQLTDNCGGHIAIDNAEVDFIAGEWMPPAAGGACILTGRATNRDGAVGTTQLALLARPGTAYPTTTLWLDAQLSSDTVNCALNPATPACGVVAAGAALSLAGSSSDRGLIEIDDSCAGHRRWRGSYSSFEVPTWTATGAPGATCVVTVRGTSLSGNVKTIAMSYKIAN